VSYRLVTLQSVIVDTKIQLDEIIDACDHLLEENTLGYLVSTFLVKLRGVRSLMEIFL
jgi:UV radiation resistance-associated gene protein